MFKKLYIIVLFVLGTTYFSFGQCFCGNIRFQFKAKDIQVVNDTTNYFYEFEIFDDSRKTLRNFSSMPLLSRNLEGDELKFHIGTGHGIDSLKIVIINQLTNEEMTIITTSIFYDIRYYIDLLEFKPGRYLFEWDKIIDCINENLGNEIILCGKNKFLRIHPDENSVLLFSVKPLDINDFKIDE